MQKSKEHKVFVYLMVILSTAVEIVHNLKSVLYIVDIFKVLMWEKVQHQQ